MTTRLLTGLHSSVVRDLEHLAQKLSGPPVRQREGEKERRREGGARRRRRRRRREGGRKAGREEGREGEGCRRWSNIRTEAIIKTLRLSSAAYCSHFILIENLELVQKE